MEHCRKAHHSESFKKDLIHRLNRINGQINGVKTMIEQDAYCDNVLNLITGIRSALAAVQRKL
ncbi:MAG TPA: metal-sensing transcriptional repressor, partial [Spirochaetales bacterium]|nr:metal-sensing transcriptional repressor [Spirochaetales bacterium]